MTTKRSFWFFQLFILWFRKKLLSFFNNQLQHNSIMQFYLDISTGCWIFTQSVPKNKLNREHWKVCRYYVPTCHYTHYRIILVLNYHIIIKVITLFETNMQSLNINRNFEKKLAKKSIQFKNNIVRLIKCLHMQMPCSTTFWEEKEGNSFMKNYHHSTLTRASLLPTGMETVSLHVGVMRWEFKLNITSKSICNK